MQILLKISFNFVLIILIGFIPVMFVNYCFIRRDHINLPNNLREHTKFNDNIVQSFSLLIESRLLEVYIKTARKTTPQ